MGVFDPLGNKIYAQGRVLESLYSNNEAEYQAIIVALEWCVSNGTKTLNVCGDAFLLKLSKLMGLGLAKINHYLAI